MPHVNDLTSAQRNALIRMDVSEIRPQVILETDAQVQTGTSAGGFPFFSANYSPVSLDISGRVPFDSPISINQEKPIFPNDGGKSISSSSVNIPMINNDAVISATQTGAIIDPDSIEDGTVTIKARIGASVTLPMFMGRITGLPTEGFDSTTIEVIDSLFDSITTELLYEDHGQNAYVSGSSLITNGVEIIQGNGYLKFHDGYLMYAEDGRLITSFSNNKPDVVDLADVRMKTGARLGNYTIEFNGSHSFRVTFPDSTFLSGDTTTVFDSPALTINPSYWTIAPGATDLTGTKITFGCRYVIEANPFTLIKLLIERGFLKNFGDIPSDTSASSFPAMSLPVVWATLDELEKRFRLIRVFVSVGNKENSAFEKKPGGKPLNCISVAQQVADHVASSILINNNGELWVQGAQIFDTPIHDLIDAHHIKDFELMGITKDNYLTVNYGANDSNGSYSKKIEHDLRALQTTTVQEIVINLPFYKVGESDNHVAYFAYLFKKKIERAHVRAKIKLLPQFGISIIPGDRVQIITSKRPVISEYFEVYKVSKSCAFEVVTCEMVRIQTPEGAEPSPCTFSFCSDSFCV